MQRWTLALLGGLAAGAAQAAEPPAVVQNVLRPGMKLVKSFEAPAGLTGYLISAEGHTAVLYVTPDGKHAVVGQMLDEQGNNLTADQVAKYMPASDYQGAWQKAQKATWIAEGAENPKSIVYVLFDPYCPYCHALWQAAQAYESAGLQVRWIPVAYLHPDSAATAAAILESKDPAKALEKHESNFEDGGIGPTLDPKPKDLKAIEANTKMMQEIGAQGTPAVLYKANGKVKLVTGMPKLSQLPQIFGLPEQKITNPDLDRFR